MNLSNFNVSLHEHRLIDGCRFTAGELPPQFVWNSATFAHFWVQHPAERYPIVIHGRTVLTPRFQQAYGANYDYSGSRNNALPIPPSLRLKRMRPADPTARHSSKK